MNKKKYIVSFPNLGNYHVPIKRLLLRLLDHPDIEVLPPEKTSKKTLEIGSQVSPDFVCVPFKYNMGNFIESLEKGANVIIQAGGGCRYGYYAQVQEQILKDMGYQFTYISLMDANGVNAIQVYQKFKALNPHLKMNTFIREFLIAIKMIEIQDELETYMRDHIVFEKEKQAFTKLHHMFLKELASVNSMVALLQVKKVYFDKLYHIELDTKKEKQILKVGIVGELYTSMEPFSTFFLEKELANMGIQTKRYTTVTYLLFGKGRAQKKLLKTANAYVNYALGADGLETVAHTLELIEQGYDGIIHIKPFGCTPEINAMPILQKISAEKEIPILYFTFDSQTSETGIKTRLEAFYDMLQMKKEQEESKEGNFVMNEN